MLGNNPALPVLLAEFVVDCSRLHSAFLIMRIANSNHHLSELS
jgi:hypothetical protein